MPVSTDGVLLGAWAPLNHARRILDIGAGSGLLSLMAAQRTQNNHGSQSLIHAIEIDTSACEDCRQNFNASPWHNRLSLINGDIKSLIKTGSHEEKACLPLAYYDHIVCNPPYFETGPKASQATRAQARHTQTLKFSELQTCIAKLLNQEGVASLVLPMVEAEKFISLLESQNLMLLHSTQVSTVEGKAPSRCLMLIGHNTPIPVNLTTSLTDSLSIRNQQGHYTQQMIELTQDFYLKI